MTRPLLVSFMVVLPSGVSRVSKSTWKLMRPCPKSNLIGQTNWTTGPVVDGSSRIIRRFRIGLSSICHSNGRNQPGLCINRSYNECQ